MVCTLRNFECGIIFLNIILRSTILYASETYYNLTEPQIRHLERIEENFLRKLFKTSKGCPIVQLYLETGHIPARFEVKKRKLLFLKYILEENPKSMIFHFLNLQFENPTRGDWASGCMKDLKDLDLEMSVADIRKITKHQLSNMIKKAIQKKAFQYLIGKKGNTDS